MGSAITQSEARATSLYETALQSIVHQATLISVGRPDWLGNKKMGVFHQTAIGASGRKYLMKKAAD